MRAIYIDTRIGFARSKAPSAASTTFRRTPRAVSSIAPARDKAIQKATEMTEFERNFYMERLIARVTDLRELHTDDMTFKIEVTKLLETNARNEDERKSAQQLLRLLKSRAKFM